MSEGQMILLFCGVYSGALSVAIWANLVARQRLLAHLASEAENGGGESWDDYQQGA